MPDALTNPAATPKIIWGARTIADKIGRTPRAVYDLIERGSVNGHGRLIFLTSAIRRPQSANQVAESNSY
jgi:hypothetical protein